MRRLPISSCFFVFINDFIFFFPVDPILTQNYWSGNVSVSCDAEITCMFIIPERILQTSNVTESWRKKLIVAFSSEM